MSVTDARELLSVKKWEANFIGHTDIGQLYKLFGAARLLGRTFRDI